MIAAAIELFAVGDAATREAARYLIAEYLRWIASAAAGSYGLSFDVDAMVTSDLEDRSKFYPPGGRAYVIRRAELASVRFVRPDRSEDAKYSCNRALGHARSILLKSSDGRLVSPGLSG
jgi:hypothetical protein